MSTSTFVSVTRAGTLVYQRIPVRLRTLSAKIAAENGGQSPYDSFTLYSEEGVPDIQRKDQLTDEVAIDLVTGTNAVYRVFGKPQVFDDSFVKVYIEQIMGTSS
jgi:hypothetical protein